MHINPSGGDTVTQKICMEQMKPGWVTISMDEYNSLVRTIEVLSDKYLMEQIEEGKCDNAKIMDFEELARELGM